MLSWSLNKDQIQSISNILLFTLASLFFPLRMTWMSISPRITMFMLYSFYLPIFTGTYHVHIKTMTQITVCAGTILAFFLAFLLSRFTSQRDTWMLRMFWPILFLGHQMKEYTVHLFKTHSITWPKMCSPGSFPQQPHQPSCYYALFCCLWCHELVPCPCYF